MEELVFEFNKQLNQELRNAYLYLSIASFFAEHNLSGFENYFLVQAREETEHAMKFYKFITERGWRVELLEIPAPQSNFDSPLRAAEAFLNTEKENTLRIWRLYDLAKQRGDKAAEVFLQWFINEQVEEEKSAMELYAKVKMINNNTAALLALDSALAMRK